MSDRDGLDDVARALAREFKRLKQRFPELHLFTFEYRPREKPDLSGEVIGRTIYIYEYGERAAIHTLYHEVYDHIITERMFRPMVDYLNHQNDLIFRLLNDEKERLVEDFTRELEGSDE